MSEVRDFGGNRIRTVGIPVIGREGFADGPYVYFCQLLNDGETMEIDDLASFCVYLLSVGSEIRITWDLTEQDVRQGDVIQVENTAFNLSVKGGTATLLIAGTKEKQREGISLEIIHEDQIKRVNKPWGYELWINGEHPGYALKRVFIKKGFRTSLQYHRFKQETNVLFEGLAGCFYKKAADIPNDQVAEENLSCVTISPISILDISPNVLHRLESLEDITLYEVSTPHLDDVIRVADDLNRGHGRIHKEHIEPANE